MLEVGKKCEKEATLQGAKVLLVGRCSLLAVNEGFGGSGRQPSFDPEAAAWDEADTAECRGEVGRNWVFGKIVHLLPIPLDFSVL